jgi:hypothetical protein
MNDDIFGFDQTPEDKFYEVLCTMNKNVVRNELHELFKRLAILEEMVGEEDLDKKVKTYEYSNPQQMEQMMQNLYLHITANMIGQHE